MIFYYFMYKFSLPLNCYIFQVVQKGESHPNQQEQICYQEINFHLNEEEIVS